MKHTSVDANAYPAQEKNTSKYAACWAVIWGASIPLGIMAIKFIPSSKLFIGVLVVFIHVAIGVLAIRAHIRWLAALDEMQRKIQLEAMAMALGALWVAFGCLLVMHSAELIHIDYWEIALLTVLAGVATVAGNLIGVIRHR
ncbi:MAG: hypothetical protein AAF434_00790 [Pseudomonadota bacterium]